MTGAVISFINMKGGVGKTTLCKEIGYTLFKDKEKKVLFIDTDPQSNLTQSMFLKYKIRDANEIEVKINTGFKTTEKSIQKLFQESSVKEITPNELIEELENSEKGSLSIIPGTLSTVFLNRSNDSSAMESALYNLIEQNNLKEKYDYILIDCPPTYSLYTIAAILPSDYYIIPVKPDAYSVLGIEMLEKVIARIKNTNQVYFKGKSLKNAGIVFTTVNKDNEELASMVRNTNKLKNYPFFTENFLNSKKYPNNFKYLIHDKNDQRLIKNINNLVDELERKLI